jgi:hypothetical protein
VIFSSQQLLIRQSVEAAGSTPDSSAILFGLVVAASNMYFNSFGDTDALDGNRHFQGV